MDSTFAETNGNSICFPKRNGKANRRAISLTVPRSQERQTRFRSTAGGGSKWV